MQEECAVGTISNNSPLIQHIWRHLMTQDRERPVQRVSGVAREVTLIKLSRVGHYFLFGDWIPEQPGLVVGWISNEHAFLSMGF